MPIMNANLLRGKMTEKQLFQSELAKKIGMCENSLSRKLLGIRDFRLAEVVKIIEELQIENPGIFFTSDVPNVQRNLTEYKVSILVICQEIFRKDFDRASLKKGAPHHRS